MMNLFSANPDSGGELRPASRSVHYEEHKQAAGEHNVTQIINLGGGGGGAQFSKLCSKRGRIVLIGPFYLSIGWLGGVFVLFILWIGCMGLSIKDENPWSLSCRQLS